MDKEMAKIDSSNVHQKRVDNRFKSETAPLSLGIRGFLIFLLLLAVIARVLHER